MKKSKILLFCLVVGLSVAAGLLCNKKDAASELMLLNVEALSQSETSLPDFCKRLGGVCFTYEAIYPGMSFSN